MCFSKPDTATFTKSHFYDWFTRKEEKNEQHKTTYYMENIQHESLTSESPDWNKPGPYFHQFWKYKRLSNLKSKTILEMAYWLLQL